LTNKKSNWRALTRYFDYLVVAHSFGPPVYYNIYLFIYGKSETGGRSRGSDSNDCTLSSLGTIFRTRNVIVTLLSHLVAMLAANFLVRLHNAIQQSQAHTVVALQQNRMTADERQPHTLSQGSCNATQ